MNAKEREIFRYLMTRYKHNYDRNQYNRTNYDEDLEAYTGYRNPVDYPLAYNESFNRILPIIYTILSRFMDQMYQTTNVVSVRPRKRKDLFNAKKVENVLNYQLETLNDIDMQGGSYLTMMKWFFNALTFGKGVLKCYWKKEERITPRRIALPVPNFDRFGNFQGMDIMDYVSQEMQTIYDQPYCEVLHNKTFIPDPNYKSIQQMPEVFLVYKRSIDYIKKMVNKGVYKNLKELGWTSSGGAGVHEKDSEEAFIKGLEIEGGMEDEKMSGTGVDAYRTPEVDIIEAYCKLIFKDAPYEVGSGLKIKGTEEDAIVHIGNYKTILSIQRDPYGIRPLFDIGCYMHPEMYWDIGMVRLTKGIQKQVDNLANLRIHNANMLVNTMLKVRADSDIDPQSLVWKPFGIIPLDDMDDVEALTIPDFNQQVFTEQERFYKDTIQDLTGMYDYNMGQTPQRQERVGVVYGIQAMGEARAKLMLMSMDYLGIRPLLKYMMVLNAYHLPSGFEYRIGDKDTQDFGQIFGSQIHPDFDFSARYTAMEPALGKQARAQQLVQMAQMWAQSPWINQYQMLKTMFELLDVRESDQLLKTPQMFQQEMQQQAQMQLMSEQMKQRFETEGKLTVSQKDFAEEKALNEQEFGHNLALKALEGEIANERPAKTV